MTLNSSKFFAFMALIGLTVAACDTPACASNVAVVNGNAISQSNYHTLLRYTLNFYRWAEPNSEYYAQNICGMEVFAKACRNIKKSLLTRMIDQEVVREYASGHHIALSKADGAVAVAEEAALKRKIGGSLAFKVFLLKLQTSHAEFRKIELDQLLTNKVTNVVVPSSISGRQLFVRQILIPVGGPRLASPSVHARYAAAARTKAEQLAARVRAGANFGRLARQYSSDPLSRSNSGLMGWVAPQVGDVSFTHAIFRLPLKQIDVVKSKFGYHVVDVMDSRVLPYTGAALYAARQHRFVAWLHAQLKSAKLTRCNSSG